MLFELVSFAKFQVLLSVSFKKVRFFVCLVILCFNLQGECISASTFFSDNTLCAFSAQKKYRYSLTCCLYVSKLCLLSHNEITWLCSLKFCFVLRVGLDDSASDLF